MKSFFTVESLDKNNPNENECTIFISKFNNTFVINRFFIDSDLEKIKSTKTNDLINYIKSFLSEPFFWVITFCLFFVFSVFIGIMVLGIENERSISTTTDVQESSNKSETDICKELLEQRKYLLREGQSVWQTDLLIDKHCK